MRTLLYIGDEYAKIKNNRHMFEKHGYIVYTAKNIVSAREYMENQTNQKPRVVVIDIEMADGIKELRGDDRGIGVMIAAGAGKAGEIVRCLREGANDYLVKPFEYDVLIAKIEAMLRNIEQIPERVEYGALTINLMSGRAFLHGEDMLLTQKEFYVLLLFTQRQGRMISGEYLYEKAWGNVMNKNNQAVKKTISRLRSKLEGSGYTINAERGAGYCFEKN